ncbi:MAG: hypothetical protein WCQ69_09195, partial [Bacteroidales bacterium]
HAHRNGYHFIAIPTLCSLSRFNHSSFFTHIQHPWQEFRIYMPAWCDTAREWDGGVWQLTPG